MHAYWKINKKQSFFNALTTFFFDNNDDIDIIFKMFVRSLVASLIL